MHRNAEYSGEAQLIPVLYMALNWVSPISETKQMRLQTSAYKGYYSVALLHSACDYDQSENNQVT